MSPVSPFLAPHRQAMDGSAFSPKQGSTYYYTNGPRTAGGGTQALSANIDYYSPLMFNRGFVFDQVLGNCTASAAGNIRWGMYAADTFAQPIGAPLFDSGDISVSSTGVKTYTPGSAIYVPAGRYVQVANTNVVPTMRTFNAGQFWIDASENWISSFTVSRTYAAFPTPGTAWTGTQNGTVLQQYFVFRVTGI